MDEIIIRRSPMFGRSSGSGSSGSDRRDALSWLPPLLFRLCLGAIFATHGWTKLGHIPETAAYFHSLGIGNSLFFAELVGWSEFVGGCLLVIGLFARFAAIPLATIMVVALLTAKAGEAANVMHLLMMGEFLFLLVLIDLLVSGPGRVSLDYLISRPTPYEGPTERGTAIRVHHPIRDS